ncbi:hypothetical protein [Pseudoalteromonas rubra]|uniref:hypothetical protein n=1 Tax=Pseudoalteromonas rubra TaxID=43658 RepID=UPI000F7920A5|nr:hypothetical protein [Pseudoalteromonas rubra]
MTSLFHFYGTYLAGLALNIEPRSARLLAKYVGQGVLQQAPQTRLNWHSDCTPVYPIHTGCSDSDINNLGPFHCKLAFTYFPAFGEHKEAVALSANCFDGPALIKRPAIQLSKSQLTMVPELLTCQPDSRFARTMLNDVIFKARYHHKVQLMSEALFGCRLYVYQNTWPLEHWQALCQCWLATCYALHCWQHGQPLKLSGSDWQMQKNARVQHIYRRLCALYPKMIKTPNSVSRERLWVSLIGDYTYPEPLESDSKSPRDLAFLEQARLLGRITKAGRIQAINEFKQSHWYKFNLAACYHCHWFAQQLSERGFTQFDTRQCLGFELV